MRRGLLGSTALVLTLPLLACSPSAPSSGPTPTAPTDTATSGGSPESGAATPTATPTATTLATLAPTDCLDGPYRLIRFAQLGGTQTYGTGQGGDVDVTFTGKSYTLRGGGQDPITLTLAGQTADLTIDGTAKGNFNLKGDRATFTLAGAKGSAILKTGNQKQRLTMDQVAAVVAPDGAAQVACTQEAMTLTFSDMRLELGRPVR